jgi:hypothetical protein
MTSPRRIQRKRSKGWRLPPNTIYVGRSRGNAGLGRWGNRYRIGRPIEHIDGTMVTPRNAAQATELYREEAEHRLKRRPHLFKELRGKNLACWCGLDRPCHADVLLKLANR